MENMKMMVSEFASSNTNWWTAVRRHWLPASITALVVLGGVGYLVLRKPLYQTQSLILVGNKVSEPVVQSENSNSVQDKAANLPTEIEVLKSQSLLSKAIKNLDAPYRGISLELLARNLRLIQPEDTTVLSISYEDENPLQAKAVLEALVRTYIEYGRDTQRSPVTNAVRFIEKKLPPAQAELEKSSRELTNFRIRNNLGDGEAGINLAYSQKESFRVNIAEAELTLYQTQQQYQALQGQIRSLQQNAKTLLADAVLSQDSTYQSIVKQLQTLNIQYQSEKALYTPDHPRLKLLKEQIDGLNQLSAKSSQQVIGTQNSVIASKKIENGEILQTLGSQLSQLQLSLLTQQKQLPQLREQEKAANLELDRLLKLQQTYKTLQRREAGNLQTVDAFKQKVQELRIMEAQETSSWKVIEPPMLSSIPVDKNRNRGLILALLAGIISGAAIAVWLDKIEQHFRNLQELKQMIPLPILGLIPKAQGQVSVFKNAQSGLVNKSNAFTEAIRSLALSLSLQTSHRIGQAIVIAAATTGEGTTTMTCNLGLVLAELGKRVLIVDANLADPQIHQVFSLSNTQGLSTAIATDLTWQSLVQSTAPKTADQFSDLENMLDLNAENSSNGARPNMRGLSGSVLTKASVLTMTEIPPVHQGYPDVLTAGSEITSSFLWLVSPKMNLMLEQWRQVYDYILIDTSAISELVDAQTIIPKVDEVAFVVDLKRAERAIVLDTLENLRTNQSQIAGIIVNNVD